VAVRPRKPAWKASCQWRFCESRRPCSWSAVLGVRTAHVMGAKGRSDIVGLPPPPSRHYAMMPRARNRVKCDSWGRRRRSTTGGCSFRASKSAHDLRWSVTVDGNPGQDARALSRGDWWSGFVPPRASTRSLQTDQSGSTVGIGATMRSSAGGGKFIFKNENNLNKGKKGYGGKLNKGKFLKKNLNIKF